MNYSELVRLATTDGPMRDLALQALMAEYTADDRVDNMAPRGRGLDAQAYVNAYADAVEPQYHSAIPLGGESEDWQRQREGEMAQEAGVRDLMELYDKPWYEDLGDVLKGIDPAEAALEVGKAVAPVYSQLDSNQWASENFDKYLEMREHDPLGAMMYLPSVALGTIGSIPGGSQLIAGGRKLGKGTQMLLEGLF